MSVLRDVPASHPRGRTIAPVEFFTENRDPIRRAGRDVVRRTVLAMKPIETGGVQLPGPLGPADGVFWGLRSRNGLSVALRAASFHAESAANHDAAEIVARSAEWQICPVSNARGDVHSVWIVLDDRVVLVGGQSWRKSASSAGPAVRRILAALPQSF